MKISIIATILILLFSCKSMQPNYNKGKSHNSSVSGRMNEVYKFDKQSKKAMIKHRNKHSKGISKPKHKSKHKKYIK